MEAWVAIILIRLIVPLTILRWPLFGTFLGVIADNLDVVILDWLNIKDFTPYNRVDKFLDIYFYYLIGYKALFWKNKIARNTAIFLLIYRTIGFTWYELSNIRALLFIFPNVFIFYTIFYLLWIKVFKVDPIKNFKTNLIILVLLLIPKLAQEYMLHVIQFPIYGLIRQKILFFL